MRIRTVLKSSVTNHDVQKLLQVWTNMTVTTTDGRRTDTNFASQIITDTSDTSKLLHATPVMP
jgi:hypothetical protein